MSLADMVGGTLSVRHKGLSPEKALSRREREEKRLAGMQEVRRPHEGEIFEIASLAQPSRSRHVLQFGNGGRGVKSRANRLYDGHAIRSFRYLTGGMYSGMSSPNRPWAAFELPDRDLMQYQPVKVWLAEAAKIVLQTLASSNFYAAKKIGYSEIGLFGTDACFMAEQLDWETGEAYPVCYPQTFGEYWIGLNYKNEPDRLTRKSYMTVEQVVRQFVADPLDPRNLDWNKVSTIVRNLWDKSSYEQEIPVFHATGPNDDHVPGRLDNAGKAWSSIKWEEGGDKTRILEERGFHSQPFWAPRWEVSGTDVYGHGPGHDSLADMRVLQLQAKRKGEATDYAVKPPLIAPSNLNLKLHPGAVTYASQADMAKVSAVFQTDYRAIEVIGRDQQQARDAIDDATYAKLFMAISRLEGSADRTVPEIAAREEEKLTQLGPVIERVNTEGLAIAIDRAFDICARNGRFAPPPEEMGGMPIEVNFTSILAQAQKMIGMQQTERALGFVANMEAISPGASDNIDGDRLVADYWERAGASPEGLRDPRDRDRMRQERQQAQQAQQMMQNMGAMKQGADAAKALAETPVAGGEASFFDKIVGAA